MEDKEFEQMLERLLGRDYSAGTEAFRDALLAQCLDVLGEDSWGAVLDDDELDMLAAAGPMHDLPSDSKGPSLFF